MNHSHAVIVTPLGRRGFLKTFGIDAPEAATAGNWRPA
jgi:hypothetical protein